MIRSSSGSRTILHTLPDFALGGGQMLLLRNLLEMNNKADFKHCVYGFADGPMAQSFKDAGIATYVGPKAKTANVPLADLVQRIRSDAVNLIHTNNTPVDFLAGHAAAMFMRLPVVNTFHAAILPRPPLTAEALNSTALVPTLLQRLKERGIREIMSALTRNQTRALTAVSESAKRSFAHHFKVPADRISVISPGLERAAFSPLEEEQSKVAALRQEFDAAESYPLILSVGRLEHGKGQRILVQMMAEVVEKWPRALLLIAGEGEDRKYLEQLVKEHDILHAVRLIGNRTDVPYLLRLCHLFVSASASEGFGLSVLEAMAAGKPVVAVHTPAYADFATDGVTGIFLPLSAPDRMAVEVTNLAAQPLRMEALGAAGLIRAREFTVERTCMQLARVYDWALSPGRARLDEVDPAGRQDVLQREDEKRFRASASGGKAGGRPLSTPNLGRSK
jgi:glycosyltransferase involved in cell wall biosynthesis